MSRPIRYADRIFTLCLAFLLAWKKKLHPHPFQTSCAPLHFCLPYGASPRTRLDANKSSDEEAYEDVILAYDSEMPLVLKAYFYMSAGTTVTAASASLDVTYVDGSSGRGVSTLDFGSSSAGTGLAGTWTQNIAAVYPTEVISTARVRIALGGGGSYRRNCVEICRVIL